MSLKVFILSSILSIFCKFEAESHGYMYKPTNRASLWRVDRRGYTNFEDNAYFCGGFYVQYYVNGGKCGPCGDDWRDPVPRSNENGGFFGKGIVLSNYSAGQVIEVNSLITANHLGSLHFSLCKLEEPDQPETEECFEPLKLSDGRASHPIQPLDYEVVTQVKLPDNFSCERCVLRWHYRTGNSWGLCQDGTQNMGCGNQEIFRSCADITIQQTGKNPDYVEPTDPHDGPPVPEKPTDKHTTSTTEPTIPADLPRVPHCPGIPEELLTRKESEDQLLKDPKVARYILDKMFKEYHRKSK